MEGQLKKQGVKWGEKSFELEVLMEQGEDRKKMEAIANTWVLADYPVGKKEERMDVCSLRLESTEMMSTFYF